MPSAEDRALDLVSAAARESLRAIQLQPQARPEAVGRIVDRFVDVGFVLRATVPPTAWEAMSDADRQTAGRAYRRLAADQYSQTFGAYRGERVDVLGLTLIASDLVRVDTVLKNKDESIPIAWIVAVPASDRGGVRDIVIDGASSLAAQQALFGALWDAVGEQPDAFLERLSSDTPWEDMD